MKRRGAERGAQAIQFLDWIHQIRRELQLERGGQPARPLSKKESEKLAKRYGLKLARFTTVGR